MWLAAGFRPAAAQPEDVLRISEDEVYTFLSVFLDGLTTCNTEAVARTFLDSARIKFISSFGRRQVLTPPQFIERLKKDCRPYENLQWDQASTRVSIAGDRAAVSLYLSWGANKGRRGRRRSTLLVLSRIQLVRRRGGLAVSGLSERFHELVPGAEEAFWSKAEGGGLAQGVVKFYHGLAEMMRSVKRRTESLKKDSGL